MKEKYYKLKRKNIPIDITYKKEYFTNNPHYTQIEYIVEYFKKNDKIIYQDFRAYIQMSFRLLHQRDNKNDLNGTVVPHYRHIWFTEYQYILNDLNHIKKEYRQQLLKSRKKIFGNFSQKNIN